MSMYTAINCATIDSVMEKYDEKDYRHIGMWKFSRLKKD